MKAEADCNISGSTGDRVVAGLTIMLTCVAFKFVINDKLPDLPYQTFMDQFLLAQMLLQV